MGLTTLFSNLTTGSDGMRAGALLLALLLSSLIGLERELRLKSAGLRTHALVGLASALIMLVSKYGFTDVVSAGLGVLDPSRIAAQIVSGIGFIGGGLIFVQKNVVRGLTTAAVIWLTAGIGMACGAGLPFLAIAATLGHFAVTCAYHPIVERILKSSLQVDIDYTPGQDLVERVLNLCTAHGFAVGSFSREPSRHDPARSTMSLILHGPKSPASLLAKIADTPGISAVTSKYLKDE